MNRDLFIFDIAQNHCGSLTHGLDIIASVKHLTNKYPEFDLAIKFQMREISTFIHPDYKNRTDIKYVKRFKETELTSSEFILLNDEAKRCGFKTISTAFDESSVEQVAEMKFDYIKIGSCSFTDWPLLNKIAATDLPIIASCAGSSEEDLNKVVSFFVNRNKSFSLMHCVGEYPTLSGNLQLNQIKFLRDKYPNIEIGYSTHEEPNNFNSIYCAVALGAKLFEKHVCLENSQFVCPNLYSVNSEQIDSWLKNAREAIKMCGVKNQRCSATKKEQSDLKTFKRGVFLKRGIEKGEQITRSDVFYAFPNIENQVLANDMSKYAKIISDIPLKENQPLLFKDIYFSNERERVFSYVQKIKEIIKKSGIIIPKNSRLELSHHNGLDKFEETGLSMITVINKDYCKKYLILLPGQKHPEQMHRIKKETFYVLYGDINLFLDDQCSNLKVGDIRTIEPNTRHKFFSLNGSVVEELSTTHMANDSFYTDEKINNNLDRKTTISFWE